MLRRTAAAPARESTIRPLHKTKATLTFCVVPARPSRRPEWDRLFEIAAAQEGLFTTKQAAEAGYSPQLLVHHVRRGRVARVRRGVYRLVHFPAGEHEDLVAIWLWTERAGVMSHATALALHELSDVLPAVHYVTLPASWSARRLRVPRGIELHHADLPAEDRGWVGPIPVTSVLRTLNDCAKGGLSPELLQQAAEQALRRGLVTRDELGDVAKALAPFGGLAA